MVHRTRNQFFASRLPLCGAAVAICFTLLLGRLWYLQCLRGNYYRDLSENNRIRTVRTVAPRGNIFDRDNRTLVSNRPSFTVGLMLEDVPNLKQTVTDLASIVGKDPKELEQRLSSQRSRRHFVPKPVLDDISRETLAKIKVNSYRFPGLIIDVIPARLYPFGGLAAHLFGYAREISKAQLETRSDYRQGDLIGQAGLEKTLESSLRGTSGFRQIEVDAVGSRTGELGIVDDLPGQDVYLTIDLDLQRAAEGALTGRRGAVVVMDPRNGEVLALASAPNFDANIFSGPIDAKSWEQVSKHPDDPLTNRAISQVYPAGSTFKVITTVAALAEHLIAPDASLNCPGYFPFAGRRYQCHKKSGHGHMDMKEALTHSCNAYYFHIGQDLGIERIHKYATLLGLGEKTGIELVGETAGIVPSEEWKKKIYGERWYPGDTLPVSIGQGYIVVTPIQMARAISVVANGGTLYRPHVLRKIVDRLTGEEKTFPPEVIRRLPIPPEVFALTRSFAAGVVADGTGKAAGFKHIAVGGKTGTAQVKRLGREKEDDRSGDHAWFVSFAPVEAPTIAMAVLIENGGHGGTAAAPVAKTILTEYFRKRGMLAPDEEGAVVLQEGEVDEGAATEEGDPPSPEAPVDREAQ